jgi:hypothetical protein
VQEIVGYNGTQNVRITPANLLSSLPGGPFLPLAGGTMTGNVVFTDNVQAQFGTGNDLRLVHNGSDSYIQQTGVGDLILQQTVNDADISFQCDDGAGGTATYFYLDGSGVLTRFDKRLRMSDAVSLQLGSSGNFEMYHLNGNTTMDNFTGNLIIRNSSNDKDILFACDDGSGGAVEYFRVDGGITKTVFVRDTKHLDTKKAIFGDQDDLQIYHDSTNSIIQNTTGNLTIRNDADDKNIEFACDNGSGGVSPYLTLDGSNERLQVGAPNGMLFPDNIMAKFGTSGDMELYHDTSHSYVKSGGTGDLYIQQFRDDGDIVFQSDDGSGGVTTYFYLDGSNVFTNFQLNARWQDNAQIQIGNSGDLRIYHDGSNSYINDTGTGSLYINGSTVYLRANQNENAIICNANGSVDLYYDGSASPKLLTTSTGVSITGGITDSNGDLGTAGQLLSSTGTALDWIDAPSGGAAIDSTYTPKAGQMPRWINGTTIGGGITGDMYPSTGSSTAINRGYTSEFLYPKLTAPFKHTGWWQTAFEVGSLSTLESMSPFDVTNFILWDIQASNSPIDFTGSGTSAVKDSIMIGNGFAQQVISTSGGRMDGNILMCMGPQSTSFLEKCKGKNVTNSVVIGGRVLDAGSFSGSVLSGTVIIGGETFETGNITDIDNGVFIGREQGKGSTGSGKFNNYVGYRAMGGKVNGTANTAMGYLSGFDIGSATTSNYNAFYGASAGQEHVSGDYNTFIGYASGPTNNAASTGSNNTAIGNGAQFSAAATSNEIVLGNSSVTALKCQVQTITALSDERDKSDIVDLNYGLDLVMNLKPKKFVWDLRDEVVIDIEEKIIPGKDGEKDITEVIETPRTVKPTTSGLKDVGFIAQELKEIDNDFLRLVNSSNPEKLQASYSRLLPVLVKAIQELSAKVTDLENA